MLATSLAPPENLTYPDHYGTMNESLLNDADKGTQLRSPCVRARAKQLAEFHYDILSIGRAHFSVDAAR